MADAAIPVELADKAVAPISPHQAATSYHQAGAATDLPTIGHFRSASEYNLQTDKVDAIIRDVSYHRVLERRYFISLSEDEHELIRISISTSFQRPSIASLGTLNRLPYELLSNIALSLDIQSVFTCRQVSTGLRQTIDSFSEYQAITTHALSALYALLRTRVLAPKVSFFDFHRELCSNTCFRCDEFGEVIFLPTWRRYCSLCITHAPEVLMGPLDAIQSRLALSPEAANQLPVFETIRQTHSVDINGDSLPRDTLVPIQQAVKLSPIPQRYRDRKALDLYLRNCELSKSASCILPYYNRHSGKAEYRLSC